MSVYKDVHGNDIILSDDVRAVILEKHPEVETFLALVEDVLSDPDEIRASVRDPRVVLYYRYQDSVLNRKWLVVVVKQVDKAFISTIFMLQTP